MTRKLPTFKPKTPGQVLDSVLPHLKKASAMPASGDPEAERGKFYKACDEGGRVFLVTHPCTWPEVLVGGQVKKIRPRPIPYSPEDHEVEGGASPSENQEGWGW